MNGLALTPGDNFVGTYEKVLTQKGGFTGQVTGFNMVMNSLILGIGFAVGKIVLSMMAAYAIVYFRFRFATLAFWIIFTRCFCRSRCASLPSYEVMSKLGCSTPTLA